MKTQHLHLLVVVLLLLPKAANALFFDFIADIFNALIGLLCILPVLNLFCNDCNPDPCLNDGVCTDQVGGFTCTCDDGWSGETCDVNEDCGLFMDWDVSCVLADGPQAGLDCEDTSLGYIECLERPRGATMRYNGGNCDQSDNSQPLKFECQDMNGGPPTTAGEESFIVVTDVRDEVIIYFQGPVAVDSLFRLDDGGDRFAADMFITIYTPDQSTMLQKVRYHSSCSEILALQHRFGASELVEFLNDLQGLVSSFALYMLVITINLSTTAETTEQLDLTSMTAMTSFAGTLDLTDQVVGQAIGGPGVVVRLEDIEIDATVRELYTIVFNIEGTLSDGVLCTGMNTFSIEIGYDPNGTFRRLLSEGTVAA